jgi:hypothetical protein
VSDQENLRQGAPPGGDGPPAATASEPDQPQVPPYAGQPYPGYAAWSPAYPPGAYPPPAPKNRTRWIVGIAVGLVVLLAGAVGAYLVLRPDDSPRSAFDNWWAAVQDGDIRQVRALTCAEYAADGIDLNDIDTEELRSAAWAVTEVDQIDDDTAEVTFTVSFSSDGQPMSAQMRWSVVRERGSWKLCGPVAN